MSLRFTHVLFAALAALNTAHCSPSVATAPTNSHDKGWELKVYDVPEGVGNPLVSALRGLFVITNADRTGEASLAPNGQLLVTAPRHFFPGIDALVASTISKRPQAPASIQLTYWAVTATPAAKADVSASLQAIAPALDAIAKTQGGLLFKSLETLSLRSTSGSKSHAQGNQLALEQQVTERDGVVVADIDIRQQRPNDGPVGRVETRVQIKPGQTVVLGQTGFVGDSKEPGTVFYVVRAEVEAR